MIAENKIKVMFDKPCYNMQGLEFDILSLGEDKQDENEVSLK